MTIIITDRKNHGTRTLVRCPTSSEQVTLDGTEKRVSIPQGQAIWWNCSVCQGWHVLIENKEQAVLVAQPCL